MVNKAIPREIWLRPADGVGLRASGMRFSISLRAGSDSDHAAHGSQSAAASSSPPPVGVADALRYFWVRETRDVPGLFPPAVESIMKLDETEFQYLASQDWDAPVLVSTASASRPDRVTLRLKEDSVGCSVGAEGTYTFKLSETGRALTVRGSEDSCAAREAAISGKWTRAACPDSHVWCLGELDAGRHESVNYTPFVRFPDWQFKYGRFAYRVPEGWANTEDNRDGYVLTQSRPGPEAAGIFVFSDVLATHTAKLILTTRPLPDRTGPWTCVRPHPRSVTGFGRCRASRSAMARKSASGDWWATRLDVSMNPAWKGSCGWSGDDGWCFPLLNAQSTAEEGLDWGIARGRTHALVPCGSRPGSDPADRH